MNRNLRVLVACTFLAGEVSAECLVVATSINGRDPSYQVRSCISAMEHVETTSMYLHWEGKLKANNFHVEGSALKISKEYRNPLPGFRGELYEPHTETLHYPGECKDVPLNQDIMFNSPEQDCC